MRGGLRCLEWGPKSPLCRALNIDGRCLALPAAIPACCCRSLGRPYGDCRQSGESRSKYDADTGSFAAWYFEPNICDQSQALRKMLRTNRQTARRSERRIAWQRLIALAHETPRSRRADITARHLDLKSRLATISGAALYRHRARAVQAYKANSESRAAVLHGCSSASIIISLVPIGAVRVLRR